MFGLDWSEFALIGVLALVLIGPKDLPVAIKAVTQMLKKARRMAGEFQTHVDDLVREANLQEVRDGLTQIRRMDIKGQILKAVDDDGSIRSSLTNPLHGTSEFAPPPPPIPVHDSLTAIDGMPMHGTPDALPDVSAEAQVETASVVEAAPPPAFVPPGYAPKPPRLVPPAFIPPHFATHSATPAKSAAHA